MTDSRRRIAATGVALALALTLSACSPGDDSGQSQGTVKVQGTVPLTMQTEGRWEVAILKDAPVTVTPLGVLTWSAEHSVEGEKYVPVLLSSDDATPRWTGEAVKADRVPKLSWVEDGDGTWAVAQVDQGKKTTLYSWSGLASHEDTPISGTKAFSGKEHAPTVRFSGSGVLVTDANVPSEKPMIFWPKDGSTTTYDSGPKRDGAAGSPVGVYDGGFLVEFPKGGFSYASSSGGWASTDVSPEGSNPQSGKIIAQGSGYVVSEWQRPSDKKKTSKTPILAVHSAKTGQLFAQYDVPASATGALRAQKNTGVEVVSDASRRWLVWGQFGFDLNSKEGHVHDLKGGTPTAVVDDMLYVKGADSLIEPPTSASASPSPSSTASPVSSSASASPSSSAGPVPDGFSGVTGVDLATGQPLPGLPSLYPVGKTATGQYVLRDDAKPSIYAVGIR